MVLTKNGIRHTPKTAAENDNVHLDQEPVDVSSLSDREQTITDDTNTGK